MEGWIIMQIPVVCVYSYNEHGPSRMMFVCCTDGHVVKELNVDSLTNAYWAAHKKDLKVLDNVTYFLKLFEDVPETKIMATDFCKDTRHYSETFPIAFKAKDCNERIKLIPGDYVVNSCKVVDIVTENARFVKTNLVYKTYNVWEVNASRIEEPENVTYHRELDYFYEEMEKQGVCVSQITDEERAEHYSDYKWLAHFVAEQYGWKLLNYLEL